ncbi:MAG: hypothetical protein ACTH5N_06750 [Psychroflexus halocasei]|uniref:hypothetical protein n=1 Tax=Psychroflexus sp. S27 TaxID=1982757 RepID=UPI000C2AA00C|nr:hypothetical protein [Psychroflexus sp. S27]PJX20137.1 hypothetical protein CAP47_11430 [Psychroflexus sp. S27]
MVTIIDYKASANKETGEEFFSLIVQGGVETVKSKETGRSYLTARKAYVSSTFNEVTCKGLIGSQIPGQVVKVEADPYEYEIPDSGEVVTLRHQYVFVEEEEAKVKENMIESQLVN